MPWREYLLYKASVLDRTLRTLRTTMVESRGTKGYPVSVFHQWQSYISPPSYPNFRCFFRNGLPLADDSNIAWNASIVLYDEGTGTGHWSSCNRSQQASVASSNRHVCPRTEQAMAA